jgi:hypothetical protein
MDWKALGTGIRAGEGTPFARAASITSNVPANQLWAMDRSGHLQF